MWVYYIENNVIFVKFEKVARRAGLMERRVYVFIYLNKGLLIREAAGLIKRIREKCFEVRCENCRCR